jgi:hypothetical protein
MAYYLRVRVEPTLVEHLVSTLWVGLLPITILPSWAGCWPYPYYARKACQGQTMLASLASLSVTEKEVL